MKYTYFRFSLIILAVFLSVSKSFAGSKTYYYAALKAQVSSTGGGKVYAGTSNTAGTYDSSSSTSSTNSTTQNDPATFYAFAQANSGYTFTGWTNTDGGTVVSTDNPYSVTVKCSSTDSSSPTTTTVYANFAKQATSAFSVTFNATENGTYTVKTDNGTTTVSTTTYTENQESGNMSVTLTATPAAGYKLYGWYTISGGIKTYVSYNATYDATFSDETSIYAEFIDKNIGLFQVGTSTTRYKGLQAALDVAGSSTTTITLVDDGTVGEGTYTIPTNITLLIPFDDALTCYTTAPATNTTYTKPSVYKTLTLGEGAKISVDGKISVSAQCDAASGGQTYAGAITGKYGYIKMDKGSTITLNNGASLYAWGFISGEGEITANSGSKVYEDFQFIDFRGGTALSAMAKSSNPKVFPINQYFVQNIEAPLTIYYGAEEIVFSAVTISIVGTQTINPTFIGTGGMFILGSDKSDNRITKKYDPTTDRINYTLYGNASLGTITISASGASIVSSDYVMPLTHNMDIRLAAGSQFTTSNDISFLPGTNMTIEEGSTFNISSGNVYVYDKSEWVADYNYKGLQGVNYSPTRTGKRTFAALEDTKIDVQGAITNSGYLYTTVGGANICCTQGNGGSITFGKGAGTSTETYQATQASSDITYSSIAITSAQLKNGDGSYTSTTGATAGTTYYYDMIHDVWGTTKVTIEKGDVNLSGTVNVADIATLANIILGHGPERHGVTDINADGTVDVEDVKALTNIILGK